MSITFSREKVEKVLNPPQIPTVIKRYMAESGRMLFNKPKVTIARRILARALLIKVLVIIEVDQFFDQRVTPYRNMLPIPPPTNIATQFIV